ncbi:hypothetical protein ACFONJ_05580 [Chryseobacterium tructae]|uniref:Uncharacterized protein n=1 Tax=Chryseobacterium tructae TaxID=1037380 RepID=A0ABV7XS07_9FLAO
MFDNRLTAEQIISAYSMIILEFDSYQEESFGAIITKKIPKSLFWEKIFLKIILNSKN